MEQRYPITEKQANMMMQVQAAVNESLKDAQNVISAILAGIDHPEGGQFKGAEVNEDGAFILIEYPNEESPAKAKPKGKRKK